MNRKIRIITEGEFDSDLLKRLLLTHSVNGAKFEFTVAGGFSYAISLARSILMMGQTTLILVLDTDTLELQGIEEKKALVESYLNASVYSENFKLILARPEFEIIFFEDKKLLEKMLGKTISQEVWELAKSSPRKNLEYLMGIPRKKLLSKITDEQIRLLHKSSLVREIIDFSNKSLKHNHKKVA